MENDNTKNQGVKPLPCPWCGDDDIMPVFIMADKLPERWQCGCDSCRIYKNGSTEEYAVNLWNYRANPAPSRMPGEAELIQIGDFTIYEKGIKGDTDKMWIQSTGGEGGDFDKAKFLKLVEDFYNEHF